MQSSSLIRPEIAKSAGFSLVTDEDCQRLSQLADSKLKALKSQPSLLTDFIRDHKRTGRLGDYFETLLAFWLQELLDYSPVIQGVPVRNEKRHTLGELDLFFKDGRLFRHWEAAVKFYMCIAPSPGEATQTQAFVGQSLQDRLDIKLNHLLTHQLPMAQHPLAHQQLCNLGLQGALTSQLFMKGRLFYPLAWDWQNMACPAEVSPRHERGWWLAWDPLLGSSQLPQPKTSTDRWVVLKKPRWLSSSLSIENMQSDELLNTEQLTQALTLHFAQTQNAIQIAQVSPSGPNVGRGMILSPGWPSSLDKAVQPEREPKEFSSKT